MTACYFWKNGCQISFIPNIDHKNFFFIQCSIRRRPAARSSSDHGSCFACRCYKNCCKPKVTLDYTLSAIARKTVIFSVLFAADPSHQHHLITMSPRQRPSKLLSPLLQSTRPWSPKRGWHLRMWYQQSRLLCQLSSRIASANSNGGCTRMAYTAKWGTKTNFPFFKNYLGIFWFFRDVAQVKQLLDQFSNGQLPDLVRMLFTKDSQVQFGKI